MKLRTKPQEPKRITGEDVIIQAYDPYDFGGDIQKTIDALIAFRDDKEYYDVYIDVEHSYDSCTINIRGKRNETATEFAKRMASYKARLADYNTWYNANKEAIERTIFERKQRANKQKEAEIAKLEKEIARIRSGRR